jgi:hypothetical protein
MTVQPVNATNPDSTSRLDTGSAHPARVYNYWLGGHDNFPADREAAEAAIAANPGIAADVRANRAFLARVVRYLVAECGIRQFLDVGTGLPTASNTHQVAQAIAPESRIVYVDNDPIVLAHAGALLTSTPQGATAYLDADLREPEPLVKAAACTLDFTQPIALMLLIILHLIPDAECPRKIVARLMSALPAGSYLVLAHPASDVHPDAMAEMTRRVNERMRGATATMRTYEQVASLFGFGGLKVLPPGVVQPQYWRPDAMPEIPAETDRPAEVTAWCGVARKSWRFPGGDHLVQSRRRGRRTVPWGRHVCPTRPSSILTRTGSVNRWCGATARRTCSANAAR